MAQELTTGPGPAAPGSLIGLGRVRPAELVELAERVYRGIFRAGLWVAVLTTGYAGALVFIQVGAYDRILALAICLALTLCLWLAARVHDRMYGALRRFPALTLVPALALAAGHVALGPASQVLFPPTLIVLGLLSCAVPARWLLVATLLVGAAQGLPVLTHELSPNAQRGLTTAAAALVFAPLLFAALIERLARLMLDLQSVLGAHDMADAEQTRATARPRRPKPPQARPRLLARGQGWSGAANPKHPAAMLVTARQRQAILLAGLGESHSQIAAALDITVGRVTKLLAQARERVGVTTTQQLVTWAITTGLIPPSEWAVEPSPSSSGGGGGRRATS